MWFCFRAASTQSFSQPRRYTLGVWLWSETVAGVPLDQSDIEVTREMIREGVRALWKCNLQYPDAGPDVVMRVYRAMCVAQKMK